MSVDSNRVAFDEAKQSVTEATDELIAAIAEFDPDGIRRAIDRRGAAMELLGEAAKELRRDPDRGDTVIEAAGEALAEQANRADARLRALMERRREVLATFRTDCRAVRAYGRQAAPETVSMDRSG